MSFPRLIGDIGGTNARFALQHAADGGLTNLDVLACADFPSLEAAMQAYLATRAAARPVWCVIGIATPVSGDDVRMTNHHWSFTVSRLKVAFGFERLLLINDFTALALALPGLAAGDVRQVGAGRARVGEAIGLLGPGTGLGVGGLVRQRGGGHAPVIGEGGHVTLAPANQREADVIEQLRQRHGHVSAERALSGQGLVNLFDACCALDGRTRVATLTAADITARAVDRSDAQCIEALALFFGFLGSTAGNLALTLGAHGGVYIGGGIVPRLLPQLEASTFRTRFEDKGRFGDYLRAIPTWVITAEFPPALAGAARAFDAFD